MYTQQKENYIQFLPVFDEDSDKSFKEKYSYGIIIKFIA